MLPRARAPCGYRTAADRPAAPGGINLDPAEAAVVRRLVFTLGPRRGAAAPPHAGRSEPPPRPRRPPPPSEPRLRATRLGPWDLNGTRRLRRAGLRRPGHVPRGRSASAPRPIPSAAPTGRPKPTPPRAEWIDVPARSPRSSSQGHNLRAACGRSRQADRSFSARNNEVGENLPAAPPGQPRPPRPGVHRADAPRKPTATPTRTGQGPARARDQDRGRPAARVTHPGRGPWTSWPGGCGRPPAAPRGGPEGVPLPGRRVGAPAPAGVPGEARAVCVRERRR